MGSYRSIKNKIFNKSKAINHTFIFELKRYKYENVILLLGSGRSGTTWISNIINYRNDYRYVFEPFNTRTSNTLKKHFNYLHYLNYDNSDSNAYKIISDIIHGKVNNVWVNSFNRRINSKEILIKDIRANLMAYYIYNHFTEIPIVFVIRHPLAVTYSKMKLNWDTHLDLYLSQNELIANHLFDQKDYIKFINEKGTKFQKHIVMWCIENYVPLNQFQLNDIHFTFYENLIFSPKKEFERLFNYLNKEFNDEIFRILKTPSPVARTESSLFTGQSMITSWEGKYSNEEKNQAMDILKKFNLEQLYTSDSLGDYNTLKKILSNS
ncbi:hypothetical protein GCM10009001_24540 [Virgibacillus siamensis]|uniref:Sulfotransferase domain-containing protein n=1 Tax=Virgibacillus siamensis TaxID=480071 RepID=A0ABN1G8X1_9BACI